MKRLLKNLLGNKRQAIQSSEKIGQLPALRVEELETRALMTVLSPIAVPIIVPAAFSDGNFTVPALAARAYQYDPTATPWAYADKAGVSSNGSGFTAGNPIAPGGAQVAFLQETGSMSQSFSLAAGSYSLSFQDAQRANVQAHFQAFNVIVDGKLVDVVIPTCTLYTTHLTPNFTVAGTGSHTLRFQGVNPLGGDNTAFITAIQINPALTSPNPTEPALLAQALTAGSLSYANMMNLFGSVEADNVLTNAELQGLQTIVADAAAFHMPADVSNLAGKVTNGDPANSTYRYLDVYGYVKTVPLGNLHAGSSVSQLAELVNKWFRGVDYPATSPDYAHYANVSGNLFDPTTHVPRFTDVRQGGVGDCWLMSSFEEAALQTPSIVSGMFAYEGTNIWSVRFYVNGTPTYVTVDTQLPGGGDSYDHPLNTILWAALAEKAYAQLTTHSYASLNGGSSQAPLAHITGRDIWERSFQTSNGEVIASSGTSLSLNSIFNSSNEVTSEDHMASKIADAFHSGQLVTFGSSGNGPSGLVAPSHMYALLNIDQTGSFVLGNPWGPDGGTDGDNHNWYPGSVTLSKDALFHNFNYLAFTTGASPANAGTSANPPVAGDATVLTAASQKGAANTALMPTASSIGAANAAQPTTQPAVQIVAHAAPSAPAKEDGLTIEVAASLFARHDMDHIAGEVTLTQLDAFFAKGLHLLEIG